MLTKRSLSLTKYSWVPKKDVDDRYIFLIGIVGRISLKNIEMSYQTMGKDLSKLSDQLLPRHVIGILKSQRPLNTIQVAGICRNALICWLHTGVPRGQRGFAQITNSRAEVHVPWVALAEIFAESFKIKVFFHTWTETTKWHFYKWLNHSRPDSWCNCWWQSP